MKKLTVLLAALLLLGICSMALAQDFKNQAPFGESELAKFMDTWPGFAEWAEKYGEKYQGIDSNSEAQACSKEMLAYLSDNGWAGDRFFYVAHQVTYGLAALETKEQNPKMNAELEQTIREIKNNPDIPPAQKTQMLAMMKTSQEQMSQIQEVQENMPAQEMALITAKRGDLKKVLGME